MPKTLAKGARMFATNATDVADERMRMVEKDLEKLERGIAMFRSELALRQPGHGFVVHNCTWLMDPVLSIYTHVSQANGAIQVRGTE